MYGELEILDIPILRKKNNKPIRAHLNWQEGAVKICAKLCYEYVAHSLTVKVAFSTTPSSFFFIALKFKKKILRKITWNRVGWFTRLIESFANTEFF